MGEVLPSNATVLSGRGDRRSIVYAGTQTSMGGPIMFGRLSTHSRPRRTSTCASLWAVLLGFAVLLLLMAVQAPAAGAAGRSVLIVAPHPDDDLLYGAGVVANALAA